jgi:hypothetical protein
MGILDLISRQGLTPLSDFKSAAFNQRIKKVFVNMSKIYFKANDNQIDLQLLMKIIKRKI